MPSSNIYLTIGRLALGLSLLAALATLYLGLRASPGDRYTLLVTAMLWIAVGILSYIAATLEARGSEGERGV
ncbi:MAG: hypothetical protein F7C32_01140 [Desulfurococcales archaeon]|nr:hypothetical protein [Desulfurococcales archaeon]